MKGFLLLCCAVMRGMQGAVAAWSWSSTAWETSMCMGFQSPGKPFKPDTNLNISSVCFFVTQFFGGVWKAKERGE